jgi:D-alanyl-D-alanine carboxypeptidase
MSALMLGRSVPQLQSNPFKNLIIIFYKKMNNEQAEKVDYLLNV